MGAGASRLSSSVQWPWPLLLLPGALTHVRVTVRREWSKGARDSCYYCCLRCFILGFRVVLTSGLSGYCPLAQVIELLNRHLDQVLLVVRTFDSHVLYSREV